MAEKKEEMGAVTKQLSAIDDDVHNQKTVKEATVASVALGKCMTLTTMPSLHELC